MHEFHHQCEGPAHEGLAHKGLAHEGPTHKGLAHEGLAHEGPAHEGLAHKGPAHAGLLHDEGLAREGRLVGARPMRALDGPDAFCAFTCDPASEILSMS